MYVIPYCAHFLLLFLFITYKFTIYKKAMSYQDIACNYHIFSYLLIHRKNCQKRIIHIKFLHQPPELFESSSASGISSVSLCKNTSNSIRTSVVVIQHLHCAQNLPSRVEISNAREGVHCEIECQYLPYRSLVYMRSFMNCYTFQHS